MRSARECAAGLVHVATSRDLAKVSGERYSLVPGAGPLTKQAGCTKDPKHCGLAPFKRGDAREFDDHAAAIYDATLAALKPWLSAREPPRADAANPAEHKPPRKVPIDAASTEEFD